MVEVQFEIMKDTKNNTFHLVFKIDGIGYLSHDIFELQKWFDDNRDWIDNLKKERNSGNT